MIACISIPYFAAAVERRAAAPLDAVPLAIGGQPWEARPIFAFSREVAQEGVKAGMSLRLAHALSPTARFLPATRPRYLQASGEIVDVLLDFSPAVEPQEAWHPFAETSVQWTMDGRLLPARYFLDFDNLPAAESLQLAREMGRFLRDETQFAPALGLAAGRFAAQVAATLSRPNHARLVDPGSDAAFLAPQPLAFLPLEGEALRRLRLLGIHTLGDLAKLPRSSLVAQFGPAIKPLHRLARGQSADPAARPAPREHARRRESAEHHFEPAVADRLVLAAVVRRLSARVVERLGAQHLEAGALYLAWESEDGRRDQAAVALRRPTADGQHLTDAWLELLSGVVAGLSGPGEAGAGITRLTLGSRDLRPAAARQMGLFDDAAERARQDTWAALRSLIARHGADLFFRPALTERDHPLPERRFQLHPLAYDPTLA